MENEIKYPRPCSNRGILPYEYIRTLIYHFIDGGRYLENICILLKRSLFFNFFLLTTAHYISNLIEDSLWDKNYHTKNRGAANVFDKRVCFYQSCAKYQKRWNCIWKNPFENENNTLYFLVN